MNTETTHGLNFEYMRDTLKTTNSKAAIAVANAFELALEAVLKKHPRRGDSWEEAFTEMTCFNLAGAKLKRVELLLDALYEGKLSVKDIREEVAEESLDALAYIAFGMWKVGRI